MALWGCNLKEVESFIKYIECLKLKVNQDKDFRLNLLQQGGNYQHTKSNFQKFTSFLRYSSKMSGGRFYRVRRSQEGVPYTSRKELIYPGPNPEHKDRMNNTSFCVLYTSFHEFTAMAESRLNDDYIGGGFQLTRFSTDKEIAYYKLGLFSEVYLNSPRDSKEVKQHIENILGPNASDRIVKGFSALECAIADVLYGSGDDYHVLSSIMADAIFTDNPEIDAIAYPSIQNRYGVNFAFTQRCADSLIIEYSSLNKLTRVYKDGYFEYHSEQECLDFLEDENYVFSKIDVLGTFR
ncbi:MULTISPECIES: RES domain-containing protein [Pseudomonas syringae group]|nr:RES domain-containing protein [Pseudomonas syringae group genomosp. 7]